MTISVSINTETDFISALTPHIAKSRMHLTRQIHDDSLTNISSLWHWFQRTKLTLAVVLLPAVLLQQWRSTLHYSRTIEKNNLWKYNITKGKHWSASQELELIYFSRLLYLFSHFSRYFTIIEENLRQCQKS